MSEPLYELTDLLLQIDAELEESGGELTPEIEALLDATEGKFDAKVESICRYRQDLRAQAKGAKEEYDRLRGLARMRQTKADSLDSYLKLMMERMGRDKVETAHFKVRIQANSSPSISWDGEAKAIPEAFRKVEYSLDGTAAKAYLKRDGKLPDGFSVVQGHHVRVK